MRRNAQKWRLLTLLSATRLPCSSTSLHSSVYLCFVWRPAVTRQHTMKRQVTVFLALACLLALSQVGCPPGRRLVGGVILQACKHRAPGRLGKER